MTAWIKKWWLSLIFLAIYPSVFYLWWWLPSPWTVSAVAFIACLGLVSAMTSAAFRHYFTGKTEVFMYGCVILDIIAEAVLTIHPKLGSVHTGHDFWLCAGAFAIVIGGYRYFKFIQMRNSKA